MQRLQDGCLQRVGEEGVFVWGLEAADQRVEFFALAERPVEEAEAAVGDFEGAWGVDCGVVGELDALD